MKRKLEYCDGRDGAVAGRREGRGAVAVDVYISGKGCCTIYYTISCLKYL